MSKIIRISTISEIHNFLHIEKPKHPLVSVIRIGEKWKSIDFGDFRYSIDLYNISFKDGISGSMGYGRNSYDFQEGTIIFTAPGQTLQFDHHKNFPEESNGWSLLFHPDLIRKSELGRKIDSYSFFSYHANEALHLSEDEKDSLQEIIVKIEKEYVQNIDRHSQELILSNIKLLLDYCTRYFDRQFYTRTNLNKDVVSDFEQFLKNYFHSDQPSLHGVPSVSYCGEKLNMSPYYLSDLLKKETGRNAQEHIHYYLIERAKTVLLNSNNTVSQIAYGLGFEYPQHFSKVFKNKTGMTPSQYRSLN